MVLHIAGSLVGLIKIKLKTNTDGNVFRLHYRWTTTFCFLACLLITASEYIGKPIQCLDGDGKAAADAVNTYCWIKSTFTLNSSLPGEPHSYYSSRGSTFAGTGNYDPNIHRKTYHAYYQWVPFVLFLQGCLFYAPHLLWKMIEGSLADNLLQGLHLNSLDNDRDKKVKNMVKYLRESRGYNTRYAIVYLLCEALNFVNVITQMKLLDLFLGGVFFDFGTNVLYYALNDNPGIFDPMARIFPRVTKCDYRRFGPSGTLEIRDTLCVLPQNILNEKVFIIMWFWFIILATVTAMEFVWRVVLLFSAPVRAYMLQSRGKVTTGAKMDDAICRMPLGDYFLIDVIGKNLQASIFRDVLNGVLAGSDDTPNHNSTYLPYRQPDDDEEHIISEDTSV